MRKNIFAGLFLTCAAFGFLASMAHADDASDMMAAALEKQAAADKESQAAAQPPAPAAPAPTPVPEVTAPAAGPDTAMPAKQSVEEIPVETPGNANTAGSGGKIMIADFNTGDRPNNLGGDFGAWDKDPNDDTQSCRATFASDDAHGDMDGFALRLDYDVDSPSPAYNGFWMKLENLNATAYDTLSFYIRGASQRFTKRIKVEIKTPDNRSSSYYASGISGEWKKIEIPLKRFKGIKNWASLSELILVFDDVTSAPKKGTMLVDEIMLERLEKGMPSQVAAVSSDNKPA